MKKKRKAQSKIKMTVITPRWWTAMRKLQKRGQRALMWFGLIALVYMIARLAGGV